MNPFILGMRHHYEISSCLLDLDNQQIVQVGLALGMNYAKLKRMRSLPGDMVAAWLRREDDVLEVSGLPTWKVLSEALKDTGQTGLAMKIQQKFCRGLSSGHNITFVSEEKRENEQEPAGVHQIDYTSTIAKEQLLQSMSLSEAG